MAAAGTRLATYPTQMSAGTEATGVWTDSVAIAAEPRELTGVDVRTRIVSEVLR